MFISNPFGKVQKLFATHPPIEERVRRLRELTFRYFKEYNLRGAEKFAPLLFIN